MSLVHLKTSVILTTFNGAATLPTTLTSLRTAMETYPSTEILLVDNASDDKTPEILAEFREILDATLVYEARRGKSYGLNTAIDIAKGDLLVFIDDDVELAPGWLEAFVQAASDAPEAAVFVGQIRPAWEAAPKEWQVYLTDRGRSHGCTSKRMQKGPTLPTKLKGANFALRRDALGDLRFDTAERNFDGTAGSAGGEDTDLAIRLTSRKEACIYVPDAVAKHWVPKAEMSISSITKRYYRIGQVMGARRSAPLPTRAELFSIAVEALKLLLKGHSEKAAFALTTCALKLGQRRQITRQKGRKRAM